MPPGHQDAAFSSCPSAGHGHRRSGGSGGGGVTARQSQQPGWGLLPWHRKRGLSPRRLMSLRYRKTIGAGQDQAHVACGVTAFWGYVEWVLGRRLPRPEAQPPRAPHALSASSSSGGGVPAPLGAVQRHGLPAGPHQGSATGPWQPPRASAGGAGGLCPVTSRAPGSVCASWS